MYTKKETLKTARNQSFSVEFEERYGPDGLNWG